MPSIYETGFQTPYPSREEVERWIASKSGMQVFRTMAAIYRLQHGYESDIHELYRYFSLRRSEERWLAFLRKKIPFSDPTRALYFGGLDQLDIAEEEDAYFKLRSHSLETRLRETEAAKPEIRDGMGLPFISGSIAVVKDIGWKIFVPDWGHSRDTMIRHSQGLARRGFVILRLIESNTVPLGSEGFAPVFPE